MKAGQSSKPTIKKELKGRKGSAKPTMNLNSNLANLLASLAGGEVKEERGRCVWVTGIPEDYQDADKLVNIFGNFGNVRKVVFSEKKHDTKSKDVRQAKENWRFTSNKESKFRKICMSRLRKLSSSVIVSNIPEGKSDQLKKHIIEAGYAVKSIEGSNRPEDENKPKPNTGYTMAIVELASVEEAIAAVANLHNTWPKKFGSMKSDKFGNSRGLIFSLAGVKK